MPDDEHLYIESAVHPKTGKAACIIRWGSMATALEPDLVLATARDLHTAATRAETDIAIIEVLRDLRLDIHTTAAMLRDIRTARPMPAGKVALRIEAVAGAGTGKPYVHIARGSMKASLTPDVARQMSVHWTETAVAAQLDARLRYVLGEYDQLDADDIDGIFTGLRRAGGMGDNREDTHA